MIDDAPLMEILTRLRCDRKDQKSWMQLEKILWPDLSQSIAHRAGVDVPAADHEDIAQEVLLSIDAAWPWEKTTCAVMFLGFVSQLMNHRIADHVRKVRSQQGRLPVQSRQRINEWEEKLLAGTSEGDARRCAEEELEELQALLAHDDLDRKILAAQQGCRNQDEVAALLGVSAATVCRRLERMRTGWLARREAERERRKRNER